MLELRGTRYSRCAVARRSGPYGAYKPVLTVQALDVLAGCIGADGTAPRDSSAQGAHRPVVSRMERSEAP